MELIKASATFSPRLLLASGLPRKIIIWSRIKHLLPCSPSVLHRVPLFLCRSEARERPEVGSSRYKRFVISLSLSLSYALFVSKGSWCCGSARSWLKSINPGENEGPDIVLDLRSIVKIDERDFTRCKPLLARRDCPGSRGIARLLSAGSAKCDLFRSLEFFFSSRRVFVIREDLLECVYIDGIKETNEMKLD